MNALETPRSGLLIVGDKGATLPDARELRRSAGTGSRLRLRRGVYVDAGEWRKASSVNRYLLRIQAVAHTRSPGSVLGYWSAAAVWGLARTDAWPSDVHLVVHPTSGAHSRHGIRFHRQMLDPSDVTEVRGLAVTSPARTLIDLARTAGFHETVVALDSALKHGRGDARGLVDKSELAAAIARTPRGSARATRVAEFGDGRSANPGETLSRILFLECGFPPPRLQTEHPNPDGGSYFTDFEWPEHGLIGEFDGRGKYLKGEFLAGRTPGEVVYQEKVREDHLRAEGNRVVRWGWRELHEPGRLIAQLSFAGLPFRSKG